MRISIAIIAASLALVAVATASQPAEACSWVSLDSSEPSDHIDGVPATGVVPLYMVGYDGIGAIPPSDVSVEVVDDDEEPVQGAVESLLDRVVWRAAEPLTPGATYALAVGDGLGWAQFNFTFSVAEDGRELVDPLSFVGLELTETRRTEQLCCDGIEDSCGGIEYRACYSQAFAYLPRLRLSLAVDRQSDDHRYFYYRVVSEQEINTRSGGVNRVGVANPTVIATYETTSDRYCATIKVVNLIDGSETTTEHCADADTLLPIERLEPDVPLSATCESLGHGDDEDAGGCAVSGAGGSGAGLLLVLALVAAARRRRE